jgi:tRNA(adenine34) deaminase
MKHHPFFSQQQLHLWMREAMALAEEALPQDVPVGALVVDPLGNIIGTGFNTRERDHTPIGHAELNAIQAACHQLGQWRLSGCTLIVTLEPCPMCASALAQAHIGTIVFGAFDPVQGGCGGAEQEVRIYWPSRPSIVGGVLEEECTQRLKAFFKERRR